MTAFDAAWAVLKAPVYLGGLGETPPTQYGRHYEMLPNLEQFGGFM